MLCDYGTNDTQNTMNFYLGIGFKERPMLAEQSTLFPRRSAPRDGFQGSKILSPYAVFLIDSCISTIAAKVPFSATAFEVSSLAA